MVILLFGLVMSVVAIFVGQSIGKAEGSPRRLVAELRQRQTALAGSGQS